MNSQFEFYGTGLNENMNAKIKNYLNREELPSYVHMPRKKTISYPAYYSFLYIPNIFKNLTNYYLRTKMQNNGWLDDLYSNKFDHIIMFDNQLLMYRIFNHIEKIYSSNQNFKPISVFYTQNSDNFIEPERAYIDQVWGTRNTSTYTTDMCRFPLNHVGYQGLYKVLRFLFSKNEDFKEFVSDYHVYVPKQAYGTVTDELVYRLRKETRNKLKISKYI